MSYFVWSKIQAEGGQPLKRIILLKESERAAGNGVFWWGVGNALGLAVDQYADKAGGTLPILFSKMKGAPRKGDTDPEFVSLWTEWEDRSGQIHAIPPHVLEWSRWAADKKTHYALVCYSSIPLAISDHGTFDPSQCHTPGGKHPAGSMVTTLLEDDLDANHSQGAYHRDFCASLVRPWQVKLVRPRKISPEAIRACPKGGSWQAFVDSIRAQ
jgi:hypothetical protein